ncbi:Methyl-accepting transducer domain-containing protein [Rhodovastum atsumiense]|uniref:Methyl-accepting transducer domain-containing protein n=1 Tax=Rhodovastum atsumiense TaxID=504468 RepID=A0A5M6IJ29_9PROT|nr:methyl-accepting chemotaxis protein [Rhodovastum atsumiense]KAA5607859.1 hypothetical protein F1189_31780 [Rhodovastum atsumiense]CAH2602268.1 Methyl-accepting transducer domain-containing protein [Rhodovastum atsumiense]
MSAAAVTTADRVSLGVQTVASAVEEFAASIQEITRQAQMSSQAAEAARTRAGQTMTLVRGLVDAAARIDDVVALITSIASRTNLLALNATIEAARAGEAGKGFAVVAGEVKGLASQTARATETISGQVEAIQASIRAVAREIEQVSDAVGTLGTSSGAIAASVEQQNAVTHEISRALADAAQGSAELGETVHGVAGTAERNSEASAILLDAAASLEVRFNELRQEADRFVSRLVAA